MGILCLALRYHPLLSCALQVCLIGFACLESVSSYRLAGVYQENDPFLVPPNRVFGRIAHDFILLFKIASRYSASS